MSGIIHISSVHSRRDIRIFLKECKTLSSIGLDVKLLVADGLPNEIRDSIEIIALKKSRNRLVRVCTSSLRFIKKALELEGDIYHLHDPELLPLALLLKLYKKTVVFDFHEDVELQIQSKPYLSPWFRTTMSFFYSLIERSVVRKLDLIVSATPSIGEKFKTLKCNVVVVNNFPRIEEFSIQRDLARSPSIVFIGGITEIRGIRQMIDALEFCSYPVTLKLAGRFHPPKLLDEVKTSSGWGRVAFLGYIGRETVAEVLAESVAGLVLFHPVPNHIASQPNKLFEYMSAGVPVIASDFPGWRKMIEGNNCGICVDPMSLHAIAKAIDWILEHPKEAGQMGQCGKAAVRERFNWEIEEKKLVVAYQNLLGRSK